MKYLITGGTGLVGKALIKKLIAESSAITVLTRDKVKAKKLNLAANITFINSLSVKHIEDADTIINLAGEPIADKRWSAQQKQKICHSRWDITQQLVDLVKQAKSPPTLFISGSAIGIYGRQNNEAIDESFNNFHHEFTHHVCVKWEAIANSAISSKTRVAILRTGIVLAENGGALSKMLLPFKLGLGGKISSGKQLMSWIHIDDIVAAIMHIQNTPSLNGPINITSPHAVSNKVFSRQLAKSLNRPAFLTTPAPLLKIIFGEMADLLLYGQNVKPNKLIQSGFIFSYPTIETALNDICHQ